ncbi:LysR family transcriptional regulator [Nocardia sp. CA-107356]|uniref:LysR family transcriptional regulator n=1 Tax=Nocardia sp. CA-107356 TaxID=3239972 RepID=UPI003D8A1781
MELSLTGLRVLREIAECGSFTAAGQHLGYTQSAVSRQVAALERAAGETLFDRRRDGVRLTPMGRILLRHAVTALDAMDAAARELTGAARAGGVVRLGMFISAGALVVPRALTALRRTHPDLTVTTREGTTPALVRGLRARTLDLAVLSSTPPYRRFDAETPPLDVAALAEATLRVAVAVNSPLAERDPVPVAELTDQVWIASPPTGSEPLLGVWPGLPGRPRIGHTARDWLTKLQLVEAECGITTVPVSLAQAVPAGVRLIGVEGGSDERRRMVVARLPGPRSPAVDAVAQALRREVAELLR